MIASPDTYEIVTGFLETPSQFGIDDGFFNLIGFCQIRWMNCDGVSGNPITQSPELLARAKPNTYWHLWLVQSMFWYPCFEWSCIPDGEEGSALLHRGLWKCWLQLRQKIFPKTANIKQKLMPFFVQLRLFLQGGLVAKRSRLLWSKFMMIFWQD